MKLSDFDYYLPEKLIAQSPTEIRHNSRMLFYDRSKNCISDSYFFKLTDYLGDNDVLVFNKTKVRPVRVIFGEGNNKEILFLEKIDGFWKVMVRPGRFFKIGRKIQIGNLEIEIVGIYGDGYRKIKVNLADLDLMKFLDKFGKLPIPPYIKAKSIKNSQYNTVFAEKSGSVAAPTAGLHFSNELLSRLSAKGVKFEFIDLSVGLGTFLPVKSEDINLHFMHVEKYSIDYFTAKRLNKYKADGKNIIGVGTTSIRTLEANFTKFGKILPGSFETNIFIKPGYSWKFVNSIITNFHLPKSTLLVLISAFIGREMALKLYKYAVSRNYRFFSFGDGMMIK